MTDLAQLELDLINAIGGAETAAAVEDLRVAALGKLPENERQQALQALGYSEKEAQLAVKQLPADVVVFDPATVAAAPIKRVYDLPGGADRLQSDAVGIDAVIVNGRVTVSGGAVEGSTVDNTVYLGRNSRNDQASSQDSVAATATTLATQHVRLYKALGGGWTPDTAITTSP